MTTAKERLTALLDELPLTPLQQHYRDEYLRELELEQEMQATELRERIDDLENNLSCEELENDDLRSTIEDLEDEIRELKANPAIAYEPGAN